MKGVKQIIVAIDSFKGCLSSQEANEAAAEGIRVAMPDAEVVKIPVSDGGEGFLDAFHHAIGGELVETKVKDPLMRNITAQYLLKDDTAVIEMAKVGGLMLLSPEERNPMRAISYGTGQVVADAVGRGAKHIIVGLGGSATSDCGTGMLKAIINKFGNGGTWDNIGHLRDVSFTIATDVPIRYVESMGLPMFLRRKRVPRHKWLPNLMPVPNGLPRSRPFTSASTARTCRAQELRAGWAMPSCNI